MLVQLSEREIRELIDYLRLTKLEYPGCQEGVDLLITKLSSTLNPVDVPL